ncbi:MAG: hypothetical protein BWX50_01701 [Euryarchaeota archaeon ADurb.Bin009]|nr:MAG: hypothetical protein BWX50_01701 [Euryarchaeota archaeon ADurb.Bin009]
MPNVGADDVLARKRLAVTMRRGRLATANTATAMAVFFALRMSCRIAPARVTRAWRMRTAMGTMA